MRKFTVALALTALIGGCGEGQRDEAPPGGFLNTRGAQGASATPDGDDADGGIAGGQDNQSAEDPDGAGGGPGGGDRPGAGDDPENQAGPGDPGAGDAAGEDPIGDDGEDPVDDGDSGDGPEAGGGMGIETELPGLILNGPLNGPIIADAVLVSELSPYEVQGVVTVGNGARLSIEPGTVIRMARGAAIIVGDDDHGGALSAIGTADAPIIFTSASANPQPGDWGLIAFMDKTQDAVTALRHVTVEHAGQPDVYNVAGRRSAAIAIVDSRPAIADCTIRRHQGYGVEFIRAGGANVFQDNHFSDGELAPVAVPAGQWSDIGPQASFGRNGYIEVTGGAVTQTFEAANIAVPWRITGDVVVKGADSPVLHIPPGAELQMGPETSFDIGGDELAGGLIARGTEADPILFTSASIPADPGDWGGIAFRSRALDEASVLEHVTIEYAGGEADVYAGAFLTTAVGIHLARPTITHAAITDSGGAGVEFIGRESGATRFSDNRFAGNAGASIRIPASRSGEIGGALTFEDASDRIEITYGHITRNVTWQAHQVPWRIVSQMPIEVGTAEGATLTVEPGARVETLHAGGGIRVGGNEDEGWYGALHAGGAASGPSCSPPQTEPIRRTATGAASSYARRRGPQSPSSTM